VGLNRLPSQIATMVHHGFQNVAPVLHVMAPTHQRAPTGNMTISLKALHYDHPSHGAIHYCTKRKLAHKVSCPCLCSQL
jgi:hypothetical protein